MWGDFYDCSWGLHERLIEPSLSHFVGFPKARRRFLLILRKDPRYVILYCSRLVNSGALLLPFSWVSSGVSWHYAYTYPVSICT